MTINKTIYQVDSFTNQIFKGNPAGVIFIDDNFSVEKMQQVAMEMNVSETAFVCKKEKYFTIRFFSPTTEIPLCGHATLATAHIIWTLGLKKPHQEIIFHAMNDKLTVINNNNWITMSFPQYEIKKTEVPTKFSSLIGFTPIEVYEATYGWKIAIAPNEEDIINASPNFSQMTDNDLGHLMITSKSDRKDIDYVVRCFAPQSGIDEDPVTGSAQCGLVPVWNLITSKTSFNCTQVSERTGELKLELKNNKVLISGQAITFLEGEIKS